MNFRRFAEKTWLASIQHYTDILFNIQHMKTYISQLFIELLIPLMVKESISMPIRPTSGAATSRTSEANWSRSRYTFLKGKYPQAKEEIQWKKTQHHQLLSIDNDLGYRNISVQHIGLPWHDFDFDIIKIYFFIIIYLFLLGLFVVFRYLSIELLVEFVNRSKKEV